MLNRESFSRAAPECGWMVLGVLALAVPFAVAWGSYSHMLYQGLDGSLYEFVITQTAVWSHPFNVTVYNPFQGLGSLFIPMNCWANPALLAVRTIGGPAGKYVSYGIYVLCYYVCAFVFCRSIGLSRPHAAMAAQLVSVFSFPPFNDMFGFWSIFNLNASPSLVVSMLLLAYAVLLSVDSADRTRAMLSGVAIFLLISYSVYCDPLWTVVLSLSAGFYFALALLQPSSREVLLAKCVTLAIALVLLWFTNVLDYAVTLVGYTARTAFRGEIHGEVQQAAYGFMPFQQGTRSLVNFGWMFSGAILAALLCRGKVRFLGIANVAHMLSLTMLTLVYLYGDINWTYPLPFYLEMTAYPLYGVVGFVGWLALLGRLRPVWQRLLRGSMHRLRLDAIGGGLCRLGGHAQTRVLGSLSLLPGAALVVCLVFSFDRLRASAPAAVPKPSSVLEFLQSQIGVQPGSPFRGYVTNIIGVHDSGISRLARRTSHTPYSKWYFAIVREYLMRTFGSSHYFGAMGKLGIPTVEEYSQLVSPPFYYFVSRLLCRPYDYQSRNLMFVTRFNKEALRALGVKYVLTDAPIASSEATFRLGLKNQHGITLRLYELDEPNCATYSPTRVRVAGTASEAVEILRSPRFDYADQVVLFEESPGPLVKATRNYFCFEKNAIRFVGHSEGRSLVLLPVQFSHCLVPEGNGEARLVRADLCLTGVIFEGDVHLTIRYRYGLLTPDRRWLDMADVTALGFKEDGTIQLPPFVHPYKKFNISRWLGQDGDG